MPLTRIVLLAFVGGCVQLVPLLESVYRGPAPPSQVDALMAEFDSNKDGRISWEEFKSGLRRIKGR